MVANFNPSWGRIVAALRVAVVAAGGTPTVTAYQANWGGCIKAIDELRAAIVAAGNATAVMTAHTAAADPHAQYALDTDLAVYASHVANTSNPHSTTAAQVGAIATTAAGAASGVATLDGSSKLTSSQLPLGSSAATACAGNDARLTDARTPTAHNQTASTITDFTTAAQLVPDGILSQGRLTFTSGNGLTTADVTAATTVYYTPYVGNGIHLWNGSAWQFYAFTELSLSLSGLTANTNYDVFLHDSAGLTLTAVAWTNSTTRASAVSLRNGTWVKTADDRRLLGTFRTTSVTGQSEDSALKRFLSNVYNLQMRALSQTDTTASWTYTTAAWRQTRATATNQVEVLLALDARQVSVVFQQRITMIGYCGLGVDSTTTPYTASLYGGFSAVSGHDNASYAFLNTNLIGLGYHAIAMIEFGGTTSTFVGAGSPAQCNLKGFVIG
ncbi:hypothetical protein [Stenomitos frigidus]|uniref:Uncharacterized protein n=1 Tax=Stenomitos frigidus ULC18 TaxID=2107698 RepID=A0A2T1EAZ7_9CYAN|nr:hypothetical protein [Stenomitos frigidus]PSB29890.1 hypothetical protein C7B82_10075 [Stenomitos frigidus ULC18]